MILQWQCVARIFFALCFCVVVGIVSVNTVQAAGISNYSDTLSDSAPSAQSNHTVRFTMQTDAPAGSQLELTMPAGFAVTTGSGFGTRNVELYVNDVLRPSSAAAATPGTDQVQITAGSPGFFRYTLAPDFALSAGDRLELRIGNHSSASIQPSTTFSTSTGTTTIPGDIEPVTNSSDLGRHDLNLEIRNGGLIANAKPIVFMVRRVSVPNIDTTEEIPPFRFNGAPTSTVGGTTLNVEISLETDEFAICRYDTSAGTVFGSQPNAFSNTGLIFHSTVVTVVPDTLASYYVRCIDDEGNFNIDDYLIQFQVNPVPTGSSTVDGGTEGDGTGTGSDGSGSGDGGGGTSGSSDGEEPTTGGDSGSGGSGGGGGGGGGSRSGSEGGGGFENEDGPFRSGDGRVIISGYAFPDSRVTILADGQIVDAVEASDSGQYSITIDGIARGAYTFGVYAEGDDGVKSSTFSTAFTVSGARTSALSNINVAPSISVDPDPVDPGQTVTFSGYALPDASLTIETGRVNSSGPTVIQAVSNSSGAWSATQSTAGFSRDTYQVRAKAEQVNGKKTEFSKYTFYGVGQEADVPINADLNRDGSVNLIDFSILLFWWQTDGGDSDPSADINQDGNVSLTDFSILLFNWTG